MLQEVLSKMPREEAAYHLDRCIKSGLWVPNAKDAEGGDGQEESEATTDEQDQHEKNTQDVEKLQVQQ